MPPTVTMAFICTGCKKGLGEDHRWCLVELFKTNKIRSVKEWEAQGKLLVARISLFQAFWRERQAMRPKTIKKGRIRARIPKE